MKPLDFDGIPDHIIIGLGQVRVRVSWAYCTAILHMGCVIRLAFNSNNVDVEVDKHATILPIHWCRLTSVFGGEIQN